LGWVGGGSECEGRSGRVGVWGFEYGGDICRLGVSVAFVAMQAQNAVAVEVVVEVATHRVTKLDMVQLHGALLARGFRPILQHYRELNQDVVSLLGGLAARKGGEDILDLVVRVIASA
jgi:hypothetical protein